jgi:hypothetical protein
MRGFRLMGGSLALLVLVGCNDASGTGDAGCVVSADCGGGLVCRDHQCLPGPVDAGPTDAGPTDDAGFDAGERDAGAPDAGAPDAGSVDAGPLVCAPGTADCDNNPNDCETNTATDPMNCGRCSRACGARAACTTGLCAATLLMDPDVSSNYCGAAFTTDRLFSITCWGNNDLSEVRTAPLEPGADIKGTSIVSYGNLSVVAMRGIVIDGDSVYFGIEGNPSTVFKYPTSGTGVVSIAFTTANATRFDGLQLVGDTYYWVDNSTTAAGQVAPAVIKRRAKTDTTDTELVTGLGASGALVVTETKLLWLEARTSITSFSLYQAPLAGTGGDLALAKVVAAVPPGGAVVRVGRYVYWTHKLAAPNGKLRRFEFANETAVVEDLAVNLNLPEGLVTDGQYLYLKQLDSLYRLELSGLKPPERLSPVVPANDAQASFLFSVDDRYVYFPGGPTAGDSKIYRVAK